VPTQISASSLAAISAARPGSTSGERPALIAATLSGLMSAPITAWPRLARQAADTAPT